MKGQIEARELLLAMHLLKRSSLNLEWFYLTSFFVTKFLSKSIWALNRLKSHAGECISVKYQSFASSDVNFLSIWMPKVILTKKNHKKVVKKIRS